MVSMGGDAFSHGGFTMLFRNWAFAGNVLSADMTYADLQEKSGPHFLTDVPVGKGVRVVSVNGTSSVTRRLMEMGVIPGVEISVVKTAPFGDPIEVRVRGYSLAMRRNEAAAIEIAFDQGTSMK